MVSPSANMSKYNIDKEKFALAIIEGHNPSKALEIAGDEIKNTTERKRKAEKLLQDKEVKELIDNKFMSDILEARNRLVSLLPKATEILEDILSDREGRKYSGRERLTAVSKVLDEVERISPTKRHTEHTTNVNLNVDENLDDIIGLLIKQRPSDVARIIEAEVVSESRGSQQHKTIT